MIKHRIDNLHAFIKNASALKLSKLVLNRSYFELASITAALNAVS